MFLALHIHAGFITKAANHYMCIYIYIYVVVDTIIEYGLAGEAYVFGVLN